MESNQSPMSPGPPGENNLVSLAESAVQARLKDKLLQEGVKLWQAPFFDEKANVVNDTEVLALASRYANELRMQEAEVVESLLVIQRNSIERLTERDLYRSTGLATLRIKQSTQNQKLQVNLSSTGKELKTTVAQMMNLPEERIKLISAGKVIVDGGFLESQGVKNGGSILVVIVGTPTKEEGVGESVFKDLEEIKASADYLAGKDTSGKYSLQVADQTGRALELPDAEKKALAVSLALHDKGRGAMKDKDYAKALVFLLEADTVYSQCKSNILEMVDNFGMLNLDIAWCYLCLQSITDLPAVDARLSRCEKALHKSYGENFERVIALQGSTGAESALFVRLHLLQGIAAFHLGKTEKAKFLVSKVNTEIRRLQISDEQLVELINMGYAAGESRTALRATFGDLTAAVDWIIRKREESQKVRDQEKLDAQRRKLQKRLGKCANGEQVNATLYRNLKEMGFNGLLAQEALRRTNNDINAALQLANEADFISAVMSQPGPSSQIVAAVIPGQSEINTLVGVLPNPSAPGNPDPENPASGNPAPENSPSGTGPTISRTSSFNDTPPESPEEEMKSLKALEALSKDTCPESEYIDLSLSDETAFLSLYKELLKM